MLIVCLGYASEYSLGRVKNRCLFPIVLKGRDFEVKVSESTFHPQVSPLDLPPSLWTTRRLVPKAIPRLLRLLQVVL